MAIDLLVNGVWLDIREGEEKRFFISKGLHDLRDMFGRNSDRSRSIVLPKSPNNVETLQSHAPMHGLDYKALSCQVYMGGVPVLEDASFIITGEDFNHYEGTILGGAATFYYLLSDEHISALDYSSDNFQWTLANFLARVSSGSGVETGFAQWLANDGWSQYLEDSENTAGEEAFATDIDKAGFFYMVKTIMAKIFANVGLEIDASEVEDSYKDLAVVCPMAQIYESRVGGTPAFGEVRLNADFTAVAGGGKIPFDNIIFNSGLWNQSLFRYEVTETAEFVISCQFRLKLPNTRPDTIFFLYVETPSPYSRVVIEQIRVTDATWRYMKHTLVVSAGDVVYMEAFPWPYSSPVDQLIDHNGYFSMRSVTGNDNNVLVSEWLPEISQRDFVKNIFNLYHIVASNVHGVVKLSHFKDIEEARQIDLSTKVATDRQVKFIPRLPNYAQNNVFKYASEERVRSNSFDSTIEIPDNTLPKRIVKLELYFAGMDGTMFAGQAGGVAPSYDTVYTQEKKNKMRITGSSGVQAQYTTNQANNLKAGDIVWIKDGQNTPRFVVRRVFDNKNGELNYTLAINEQDKDWTHLGFERSDFTHQLATLSVSGASLQVFYQNSERATPSPTTVRSAATVPWSSLINGYYNGYVRMIQDFQVLQVWIDITSTIFLSLNSLNPIYILGNKYYLNKTEQFKENGLVRLELIRIN